MKLWLTDRLLNLAGGIIGGVSFAAGLWLQRNRVAPLLRRDVQGATRTPYDPVAAVVRSIQNLRTKLGKP
jgi:hypothetical protein